MLKPTVRNQRDFVLCKTTFPKNHKRRLRTHPNDHCIFGNSSDYFLFCRRTNDGQSLEKDVFNCGIMHYGTLSLCYLQTIKSCGYGNLVSLRSYNSLSVQCGAFVQLLCIKDVEENVNNHDYKLVDVFYCRLDISVYDGTTGHRKHVHFLLHHTFFLYHCADQGHTQ